MVGEDAHVAGLSGDVYLDAVGVVLLAIDALVLTL